MPTPKFGDVLFHKLSEEPVLIIRPFKRWTLVRRPIMSRDGICYRFAFLLNSELETLQEQTARTIANIQARQQVAGLDMPQELSAPALQFKKPS